MGLGETLMRFRAWWFLRVARNRKIPPDVGQYLITLRNRNLSALGEIERRRQEIVEKGAADGKSVSTEAVLKYVLELRATYDGPNREHYITDLDQFVDDFRNRHGTQIPVDEAYLMLKEFEARFTPSE